MFCEYIESLSTPWIFLEFDLENRLYKILNLSPRLTRGQKIITQFVFVAYGWPLTKRAGVVSNIL